MPMAAPNPLAQAHQSIGEYFVAFSSVELELGEAIKVVFGLRDNEAGDAQSLQRSGILRARRVSYGQLANCIALLRVCIGVLRINAHMFCGSIMTIEKPEEYRPASLGRFCLREMQMEDYTE